MTLRLLTEHPLEFLSLKGGCTGLFESTLVKMPHCWKSHVVAQIWIHCLGEKNLDQMASSKAYVYKESVDPDQMASSDAS